MATIKASFEFTSASYFYGLMALGQARLGSATEAAGKEIVKVGLDEIHKRLYPGHGYRTGRLYHSYWGKSNRMGMVAVDVSFGSELHYAPYVEYRWGGKVSHFRPAMAEVERKAPKIIESHFSPAKIFGL